MPDAPNPKARMHPSHTSGDESAHPRTLADTPYAELAVTTNFTFLRGASHPEEYVQRAAELGYRAIAITDHNTLGGVVRAHITAKELRIPLVVGARLILQSRDWFSLLVFPTNRDAYGRLCRLLTLGKRRAAKGDCLLTLEDVVAHSAELLVVIVPNAALPALIPNELGRLRDVFDDDRLSMAITRLFEPDEVDRNATLAAWADAASIPLVAVNDAHYHDPSRRLLQDVLTCIRHGCTIHEAGSRLFRNGERYLKPAADIDRLNARYPRAVRRSVEIAERAAGFHFDQLRYEYPGEVCPDGLTPMQYLETLTWQGVRERFPEGISGKLFDQIHHELRLIEQLEYPAYFLTVYDIVRFARARGILCQGRGAAANSAVCFFLGVTAVDPTRVEMLFERFVSRERCEPPDIDIDFEHERREDVIQYIYQKYGRERAGLTAEVITYRGRSAVRDVGKALGLSLDAVDRLAKRLDHWDSGLFNEEGASAALRALGFDANDRMMGHVMALTTEILGFPRHRSQHVGGFVITRGALCELVPIENAAMPDRTVIEWDKDDIEAMGMLKVDVLGLGMLTCIRKSLELIDQHHGRALTLATIPAEESEVYDMICRADTVGVFQIESRAQMTMLPRLKPRNYYDLVIEVAIVRPGPIVGDMVHPFLRRRNGDEPVTYPTPEVERVLGRTLGIALFQEQAMALAIVAAGFTPGEAEMLRRTISAWKTRGKDAIPRYRSRFLRGMIDNGYDEKFALQCFERLKGFSEYGFPESHAASFALLVYSSAWIKQRYPAVFAAALLNSQPLGFYAPAQIVRDAQDHGVCVRPADVNHSVWDCTLEESGAVLRLGLRLIGGLRRADADRITDSLARFGESRSPLELWRRSGVSTAVLRILARADAFGSMGLTRQQALWSIQKIHDESLPLFDPNAGREVDSAEVELPILSPLSQVVGDYRATGLSLKAHPVSFLREQLEKKKVATAGEVRDAECFPHGRYAAVAGLVLFRQRPSTARGVVFMTLEDETGRADLIVRPHVYARFRATARYARLIIARGRVERNGLVVHVLVTRLTEIDETSIAVPTKSRDFR